MTERQITQHQVIHVHPQAAPKPAAGANCNGCGVCCLLEPCPLGMVLSGRRAGACVALRWEDAQRRYFCGAITQAASVLRQTLPRGLRALAPVMAPPLARLSWRWIAAGKGCDCSLEVQSDSQSAGQSGA